MTLDEAWQWLASFTNLEKVTSATKRTWRLDRMHTLLAERGHPEISPIGFHLAGSKGKGSTAAFLSSILTAAGIETGLYLSPHVSDWRERITRNGRWFEEGVYTGAVERLRAYWERDTAYRQQFVERWGGEPTTFEWLTLAAFEIFAEHTPRARVTETGLGGRLDATNTWTPTASVLTLIELEHTEILGSTRALIAGEKAGIIKRGVPAYVAPQSDEALAVFRSVCSEVGAPLRSFDDEVEKLEVRLSREGTRLQLALKDGGFYEAELPLLGHAMGLNAAVAAWTVHSLTRSGYLDLPPEAIRRGLETADLRGRMQVLSREPWTVLDGAHTAESARLLAGSWYELFGEGGVLVFGAFEGKAVESMAGVLAPLFSRVIVTPPGTFRPSDPEAMRQTFLNASGGRLPVEIAPDPKTALAWASADGLPVLVCGSFYLVGEILG